MSRPARLYIAPATIPGATPVRIIKDSNLDRGGELLYKNLPKDYRFTGFSFVSSPRDADFILGQHSVRSLSTKMQKYIAEVKAFGASANKPVVMFVGRDDSHYIHIDGVTQFCVSIYKRDQRPNEFLFPPYVQDLSEEVVLTIRKKRSKPVVAFCGFAGLPDTVARLKYFIKNAVADARSLFDPHEQVYKRGLYWRRKSMSLIKKDPRIDSQFIIRDSFSGNKNLVSGDPAQIRREYVENMANADFALSPKGDPNSSSRFYEALSLGRIPILIDTDMALPLEDIIDYDSFILRVPYTKIASLPDQIVTFYNSMSEEAFAAKQQAARKAFADHLRYDAFFNTVFPLLVERGPETLN